MKLLFKLKQLTAIASILALLSLTLNAEVVVYNPTATAIASILQRGVGVQQILFSNAATNAITITFTDCPTNVATYVVAAYTNNVLTLGNVTTVQTNITGTLQTNVVSTLTSTLTPVTQSTNNFRTVLVQTVPASSTVTYTPPQPLPVGFGLAASTSATNVVATITYLPTR